MWLRVVVLINFTLTKIKIDVGDAPNRYFKSIMYGSNLFNSVDSDGKSQKKRIRHLVLGMLRNKISKETQIFSKK